MSQHASLQESSYTLEAARRLFPLSREQVLSKIKERSGFQVVEKPVPFARDLTQFILFHGVNLSAQTQPFVQAYRGFDLNRRGDNLVTAPEFGTGFEGYSIGRYGAGEDVIIEIAKRGKSEIEFLKKMYPQAWRTIMKEIWEAVDGKRVTPRALDMLNRMLVSSIHDGRQKIKNNVPAQRFRENTQLTVAAAPEVGFYFDETNLMVQCVYSRAVERRSCGGVSISRCATNPETLLASDPGLAEGWRLMSKLGMVGQMVVRAADKNGYLKYGLGAMAESIKANAGYR